MGRPEYGFGQKHPVSTPQPLSRQRPESTAGATAPAPPQRMDSMPTQEQRSFAAQTPGGLRALSLHKRFCTSNMNGGVLRRGALVQGSARRDGMRTGFE